MRAIGTIPSALRERSGSSVRSVCLEAGQRDVLGVVGRGQVQLIRDLPGDTAEYGITEVSDLHPPQPDEAVTATSTGIASA